MYGGMQIRIDDLDKPLHDKPLHLQLHRIHYSGEQMVAPRHTRAGIDPIAC